MSIVAARQNSMLSYSAPDSIIFTHPTTSRILSSASYPATPARQHSQSDTESRGDVVLSIGAPVCGGGEERDCATHTSVKSAQQLLHNSSMYQYQ
eukprot:scaffold3190_cov409-Prasinococcus_capsulatus_cf.AAC.1